MIKVVIVGTQEVEVMSSVFTEVQVEVVIFKQG